ncbi:MAG: outer membrane protein transport protein [Paludibacter sp.]|nr:outer membrane protein transport protein [Paludibacter sp.]
MRKYFLLTGLLVASTMVFAQAEFDLLKYSLTDINGSARYVAMSGAFGALGGDMSAVSMNPAGLAVYRSSEMVLTPLLGTTSTKSVFDRTSTDSKENILISNFGYVGSFRTYDESPISNFNFGISYNRIKDFNRNVSIEGRGRSTSLLNRICTDYNDYGASNLLDYAWNAYMVEGNDVDGYDPILGSGEKVDNSMYLMESGGVGEWAFSLAANAGHTFYFGMSLGIQDINYRLKSSYVEESYGTLSTLPFSFELQNVLSTEGTGVNLKLGAIYRPVPQLRLGFAYHTSTYYAMTDVYNAKMYFQGIDNPDTGQPFPEGTYYQANEQDGSMDYQMKTPNRMIYSVAYQFGKKGFISLDWDVVDYKAMVLKNANGRPDAEINGYINEDFRAASNVRLGGEYRLTDNVSLRAGAAWYQSPVKSTLEENNTYVVTAGTTPQYGVEKDTYYLSGGVGYRSGAFFLDAALQHQMHLEHFYNFYDETLNANDSKYAELNTNKTNLLVSFGLKF